QIHEIVRPHHLQHEIRSLQQVIIRCGIKNNRRTKHGQEENEQLPLVPSALTTRRRFNSRRTSPILPSASISAVPNLWAATRLWASDSLLVGRGTLANSRSRELQELSLVFFHYKQYIFNPLTLSLLLLLHTNPSDLNQNRSMRSFALITSNTKSVRFSRSLYDAVSEIIGEPSMVKRRMSSFRWYQVLAHPKVEV
ncbi:hypothetical protein AVEN_137419-1, partial [Araneus ventricosus]